ncbi:histidine--tRNA ligase [Lactovum miscens]|uniref:Histidine--tRNA ligase n=1 Tax=Lactovum miscens TaxID=190387 RepID=A0A841C6M8_9LACT|nr:histidine--tRNA ligase [Lactovum miscens]MBB5887398.1 histidyl-tRNA synthetase [Lactovum miscens]
MKLQKPKGTLDIFGKAAETFAQINALAAATFGNYNFKQIETPIFESYELFSRSAGETSDIVTKEMYDFMDKGDRHIALRPEGTASVVRAYLENKLYAPEVQKPVKFWYSGPMFRYERPQSGRTREFHQIGVEIFGAKNPAVDAETIIMATDFFSTLGLSSLKIHLNSIGDAESRETYRQALVDFLTPYKNQLSEDSQRRLLENPLRILDSKEEQDKQILLSAPSILDYLNEASKKHFESVCEILNASGIQYKIDTSMVRGLDYYTNTVFEVVAIIDGKEMTVCGGGRYDKLVEYFDGPETPAFGFAIGLERLLMILEMEDIDLTDDMELHAYIAVLGAKANLEAAKLVSSLRMQGYSVDRDYLDRKLPAQYKSADAYKAELIITLGENEVLNQTAKIKNAQTRKEREVDLDDLYNDFSEIYEELVMGEIES